MTNIMDRMTRMEAEMMAKDQRIAVLEAALETRDIQMGELEEEMKKHQDLKSQKADYTIDTNKTCIREVPITTCVDIPKI